MDTPESGASSTTASARVSDARGGRARARRDERRTVSVLFADVSGFTALSERLDPEDVRAFQNELFPAMAGIAAEFEGFVEKYIGDAVVVVFGAPVAHEDDPERALRAALAMRERMGRLNRTWAARAGGPLAIHVGVNTGPAVAGDLGGAPGGGQERAYAVTGDTTNTAARLQHAARRGQILVGPTTQRLAAHAFEFRRVAPLRLKGKRERLRAYELVRLRPERAPRHGLGERGLRSSLVGRAPQLEALTRCLERLAAGRGGLVAVLGEAGLGKSRLVAEARARAAPGVTWLEGRALAYTTRTSGYGPFRELLRGDAGIAEGDGEGAAGDRLRRRVESLFGADAGDVLPYLAALLALPVRGEAGERVKQLDGEGMRRQIFRTVRRYLRRLAGERPAALVFEDLHWADESSVELLAHVLPLVREVPLLVCAVSRPDRTAPAAGLRDAAAGASGGRYTELRLAPLAAAESAQLLANLLSADGLPEATRREILAKAEGNPFFLEEVIRTLVDLGGVARDRRTGRWRATERLPAITIPDAVQGVLMARIDRLEEDARQALCLAAVVGRTFPYRVLRALWEGPRELRRALRELERLELIRERAPGPEPEYIFKHALVQEAAYESLLVRRRRELHARVAGALEALFADRLEEYYGLLAYHYARAEAWEQAQAFLLRAGDQAGWLAADAEALAHYRQAVDAAERGLGERWAPLDRAALERKIGEALHRRGEHEQATDFLRRALGLAGRPYPAARRGVRAAIAGQFCRQVGHRALPWLTRGAAGGAAARSAAECLRIYTALGWIDYFADRERVVLDALLALNLAERSGLFVEAANGLTGMGLVFDAIPATRLAGAYHRRAVALAERVQQPAAIGLAHLGYGLYEQHIVGDWERALRTYRRSAAAYQEAGLLREWGAAVVMIAWVRLHQGRLAESVAHNEELIRLGQDAADRQLCAWAEWGLARGLRRRGELDDAVAHLRTAIALAEAIPDHLILISARGELGACYLRRGRRDEALAELEASDRLLDERGLTSWFFTPPRLGLAEAYLCAAEEGAAGERAAWLRKARRAVSRAVRQCRFERGALSAALRLQGRYAWLAGEPAAARRAWERSLHDAEGRGACYDTALTHLEIGERLRERAHLDRAEALFGEIDARSDLAYARRLRAET
jgi:class 3 adenylate cyclase/tetratricopeptide (TPR) repeat protein